MTDPPLENSEGIALLIIFGPPLLLVAALAWWCLT